MRRTPDTSTHSVAASRSGRGRVRAWFFCAALATATAALAVLSTSSGNAQGWWNPWAEQPPIPRQPVRPQPPPMQAPPPVAGPAPGYSQSFGSRSPLCVQLEQRLVSESRNNQGLNLLPRIEADMRQAERAFQGAQAQLQRSNCYEAEFFGIFGKTLRNTPQCRSLAANVETSKRRLADLDIQRQQIQQSSGRSLRDDIVRELARNNCGPQYQQEASRNNGLFPGLWQDEDSSVGGNRFTYGQTFRTVCVRLCDGAFFPVSFSTLPNHFDRDQDVCQQKCAAPAELYYYSQSPGAGIEQAVSHKTRQAYTTLRTAFRFRKELVTGCSCKAAEYLPQGVSPGTPGDRRAEAKSVSGGPAPTFPRR
jgi:hypothetical protein